MVDLDSRPPPTEFTERVGLLGVRYMEAINLCLFRVSHGWVGGSIWGSPVVLLTTSGRRSGTRRTKPLLSLPDGDSYILVGSRGGTTHDPDWFKNLLAYEEQVETGEVRTLSGEPLEPPVLEWVDDGIAEVRTTVLEGSERDAWWDQLVDVYPKFASYQERSPGRLIPVLRVTPTH